MNTDIPKYDPEDLESLMAHKPFDALYPEEQAFVLKHLESPEEYDSMRAMLLKLQESDPQDHITPDPQLKEELMELFAAEKKGGFLVWLNGSLASLFIAERPWFRQPALAYSLAIGVLLFGAWFVLQTEDGGELVAHAEEVQEIPAEKNNELDKTDESSFKLEEVESDDEFTPEVLPEERPAANQEVVDSDIAVPEIEITEEEEALEVDFDMAMMEDEVAEDAPAVTDFEGTDDNKELKDGLSGNEVFAGDFSDDLVANEEETSRKLYSEAARKEGEQLSSAQSDLTKALPGDSQVGFTLPPEAFDSTISLTDISSPDNYMGNAQQGSISIEPAFTPQSDLATLETVTTYSIEQAEVAQDELSTRGLDFEYDGNSSASVPVKEYDELLDLLYTAW